VQDYEKRLRALKNVTDIHDLHVWSIGSGKLLCTAHLEIETSRSCTEVLKACQRVANSFGIYHTTFQLEVRGFFDHKSETFGGIHGHERCCARDPDEVEKQTDNNTDQLEKCLGRAHVHGGTCGFGCGDNSAPFSFHKKSNFCGTFCLTDSSAALTGQPAPAA